MAILSGCTVPSGMTGKVGAEQAVPVKLSSINDMVYEGAFKLPKGVFGESRATYAQGVIEVNGDSIFVVGHAHDDAIAEFSMPVLSTNTSVAQLPVAKKPVQPFSKVLNRVKGGNSDALDQIVGMELYAGSLVVNGIQFYDAPADNTKTTFVVADQLDLGGSEVSGFYSLRGRARAAGWLSSVPDSWRSILGCSHITGNSSGGPIIARHSVGPSAYCLNLDDVLEGKTSRTINTTQLLGYRIDFPLHKDLFNESLDNDLWTHLSQARFGFIVPGTSTYATFGISGGHKSGVGYKLDRGNGNQCAGYCAFEPEDTSNYYWLWDMKDLLRVKSRRAAANRVRPYESGIFEMPFQTAPIVNFIGGGSYDEQSGLLYLSMLRENDSPVIVAFRINTL